MSLSVCFVTRNHEASLEGAIRSVADLQPEVAVGDTGSTDQTVAVAERLGAHVVSVAWQDDFAAALNTTLDATTGDWVLLLNPDESLDADAVAGIKAAMTEPRAFARQIRVQQELRADRPGYGTADWQFRLFRRDPAARWVGRLHPRFVRPLPEIALERGETVGVIPGTIHRRAHLSTPTPDKLRWAMRLLEAELRDRPGQLPYLIEYGRHLLWLNDPKGHEVLGEAAEQVRAVQDAPAAPTPWVGNLIEYLLNVRSDQCRGPLTRDDARALAARWFPRTPPVLWAVAAERFAAGDYPVAAEVLNRLLELGRNRDYDSGGGFDPSIVGPGALLNLAMCYLKQGNWVGVKTCVAGLMTDPDYRQRAYQLYSLAEQQAAKPAGRSPGQSTTRRTPRRRTRAPRRTRTSSWSPRSAGSPRRRW